MFEDSVTYQYIGNVTSSASDGTTKAADIAAGSVALVDEAGVCYTTTDKSAATTKFRIANKLAGGQVIYSPFFVPASSTLSSDTYSANTQQVTYFGFNGSSGSLGTIVSGNVYILHVELKETAPMVGTSPLLRTVAWEATAATQYNVATGLDEIFDKQFSNDPYQRIKVERVNSASGTDTSGGVFSVTEGSTSVTTVESSGGANDAAKYDTDSSTITTGDIIRFSSATEDDSDPVYKVTAITGGGTASATITLDRPYKGDTDASYAANAVSVIASASEGNYGLKFTGLNRFADIDFDPVTDYFSLVNFKVNSDDFDSNAETTYDTAAAQGSGTYYQVAQLEVYAGMNEYAGRFIEGYPPTKYRSEADSSNTYDTIVIEGTSEGVTWTGTGQQPVSSFRIFVRTEVSLDGDGVDAALGETV